MAFPIFHQLDAMDCGPTCLRMIAAHYGRQVRREALRDMCSLGRGGVSLLGISEAAERLGMRSLAVNVSLQMLRDEVPLPCIAHWQQNHFVVIFKVTRNQVHVADPAMGIVTYSHAEFLRGWVPQARGFDEKHSGILLLLESTPRFFETAIEGPAEEKHGFQFLYSYLRPHKALFVQLGLGLSVALVLDLVFPFLTQTVVDVGINNLDLKLIHLLLLGQLMLSFGKLAIDVIQGWIFLHIGARMSTSLISDFLLKLLKLPMSFFDTRTPGDIMQRVEDHRRINTFLTSTSLTVVFSAFTFLIFAVVLGIYNGWILLIFLSLTLLSVGWLLLFLNKRRIVDFKKFTVAAQERDKFIELVDGVQEIKIQGLERPKRWDWEEINVKHFRLNSRSLLLTHAQRIGTTFLSELRNIIITYLAARSVINGEMTLGMMLSTQYIVGQMVSPIQKLMEFVQQAQDARISLERTQEIHLHKEEAHWTQPLLTTFPEDRSLYLQNVSFRYAGASENDVLRQMSLMVPEGRLTAIVGASGSGKTTLLKLLLGLYQPNSGVVYVGDAPLSAFDTSVWRQRCGVVMQDGYIFSDTIARNIACCAGPVNPVLLQAAVRVANLQEMLHRLPQGLETKIGNEGQGLSGGQKQRILIARAIYKNPEYLFLDEATSALDAHNEHTIIDNLVQFARNRTVIVIAHRLSTVRNADHIVVMHQGQIVEQGHHTELVGRGGAYFRLVRNQLELEETGRHA